MKQPEPSRTTECARPRWLQRMVRCRAFVSPKGTPEEDCPGYKSRFGFAWWFWLPRLHNWPPRITERGWHNARVLRVVWLCFAAGMEIGHEGMTPNDQAEPLPPDGERGRH